jgi:ribosomal-protein-serine acetyltransferase
MKFEQYTIRLVTMEDLPGYFELIDQNRSRLESFFAGTIAITQTLEATEIHLKDIVSKNKENNYFSFVVVDKTTGKPVASIQVKNVDWSVPKAELGYFIDKKYEGKGMITKALSKIISHCFEELKFIKLYIRTHAGNVPSRKVAEKNGFILEGTIRKDYKTTSGELVDLMYYGRVKDDKTS